MNDQILQAIDAKLASLQQARSLLAAPRESTPAPRRTLSPKARKAIAEAQRRRWARVRSEKQSAAS